MYVEFSKILLVVVSSIYVYSAILLLIYLHVSVLFPNIILPIICVENNLLLYQICATILCTEYNCLPVKHTKDLNIPGYIKCPERHNRMKDNIKYYVVKQKALPEVLLKVAEANRLIENKNISIADATEKVGISRSSYYKYKDDIFPFRDNSKGKTITFVLSMDDEPGLLSVVLNKVAEFKANILTIHQTIPVNGIASLTLSVEILPTTGDASMMIEEIEQLSGVRYLKILSSDASL